MNIPQLLKTSRIEKPEKGYYTVEEWSKKWNLAYSQAGCVARQAFKNGLMTRKAFTIKTGMKTYPVLHYKEVKK